MKRIALLVGLILCSVLAFAVKPTRITAHLAMDNGGGNTEAILN
jgi:hypothetical protein